MFSSVLKTSNGSCNLWWMVCRPIWNTDIVWHFYHVQPRVILLSIVYYTFRCCQNSLSWYLNTRNPISLCVKCVSYVVWQISKKSIPLIWTLHNFNQLCRLCFSNKWNSYNIHEVGRIMINICIRNLCLYSVTSYINVNATVPAHIRQRSLGHMI